MASRQSATQNANLNICGALRDLVPFAQFKKREKHPWRSVNFSKVAGWSEKSTTNYSIEKFILPNFMNLSTIIY